MPVLHIAVYYYWLWVDLENAARVCHMAHLHKSLSKQAKAARRLHLYYAKITPEN